MKLFGTNKNSKHKGDAKKVRTSEDVIFDEIEVNTSEIDGYEAKPKAAPEEIVSENKPKTKKRAKKMRRGEKAAVIFVIVLCALVLLLAGAYALFVKPPPAPAEIRAPQPAPERRSSPEITPEQAERAAAPLIRAAQKLAQPAAPESAGDQSAAAQR